MTTTGPDRADDVTIVDLEAHLVIDEVVSEWQAVDPRWRDLALSSTVRPEIVGSERLMFASDNPFEIRR